MSELVVTRWARYGHDRLYVQTPDGVRLGYWDNKTNTAVADDETHLGAVATAVAMHMGAPVPAGAVPEQAGPPAAPYAADAPAAVGPIVPGASPSAAPAMPALALLPSLEGPPAAVEAPRPAPEHSPAAEPSWEDLADNRPGQAAREQAVAHRQAAPVKTLLARVLGVHTDERAWRIGADGEEAVAARLAKLGPEWRVLHAVPVGERGSDIDHVVIGPAGVFTINAKHHPHTTVWVGGNTFLVGGHRQPYVRNSRHEAARASRLLSAACGFPVPTVGLIAVMGAHDGFTVKSQPPGGDVFVLARVDLAKWLRRRPVGVLSSEQVEAVHDQARRSITWRG